LVPFEKNDTTGITMEPCTGSIPQAVCGPKFTVARPVHAPKLVANLTGGFHCTVKSCSIALDDDVNAGKFSLKSYQSEPGTKLKASGKEVTATATEKNISLVIDTPAVEKLTLAEIDKVDKVVHEVPFTLVFPDGATVAGTIKGSTRTVAAKFWSRVSAVTSGPVKFDGEPERVSPDKTLQSATGTHTGAFRLGDPKRPEDIDLILTGRFEKRKLECGTYENKKTGKTIDVDRVMNDVVLTVYDRRTGKKRGEKKYVAPPAPGCGSTEKSDRKETFAKVTDASTWAATFLKP
jgi:hypothetical protein